MRFTETDIDIALFFVINQQKICRGFRAIRLRIGYKETRKGHWVHCVDTQWGKMRASRNSLTPADT